MSNSGNSGGGENDANKQQQHDDLLWATKPWLARLPTLQELKALRAEAAWNPAAAEAFKKAAGRIEELQRLAKEDHHDVKNPAFVAEKAGEIIGYASMDPVLMMCLWMHSQRGKARDSVDMLNQCENEAARRGFETIFVPCDDNSPFRGVLDGKFGYRLQQGGVIYMKNLR
jgi:hypothetical protein